MCVVFVHLPFEAPAKLLPRVKSLRRSAKKKKQHSTSHSSINLKNVLVVLFFVRQHARKRAGCACCMNLPSLRWGSFAASPEEAPAPTQREERPDIGAWERLGGRKNHSRCFFSEKIKTVSQGENKVFTTFFGAQRKLQKPRFHCD